MAKELEFAIDCKKSTPLVVYKNITSKCMPHECKQRTNICAYMSVIGDILNSCDSSKENSKAKCYVFQNMRIDIYFLSTGDTILIKEYRQMGEKQKINIVINGPYENLIKDKILDFFEKYYILNTYVEKNIEALALER